jgi:hypothetical protein
MAYEVKWRESLSMKTKELKKCFFYFKKKRKRKRKLFFFLKITPFVLFFFFYMSIQEGRDKFKLVTSALLGMVLVN